MSNVLIHYLKNEILGDENADIAPADDLLGTGLVDSMGMMKFIGFIESEYGFTVPPGDMVIENFMTVEAIENYIKKSTGE